MPNHVRNVVKIKNIPKDKIDYILNKLAVKYTFDMTGKDEWIMDFDLIIPEPRYESDCPKEYFVNKDSHIAEYEGRSWFDWYRWHLDKWGTKWNAYDGYTIIGKTQLTFVFSTAWTSPVPIYVALGAFCVESHFNMEIRYADEAIGHNCGIIKYSSEDHDVIVQREDEIANPERFANYIWNKY